MKRIFCLTLLCLLSINALGQGILDRFDDPVTGKITFIEKGGRAIGISGAYRSLDIGGDVLGDGYAIMSLLNIGQGRLSVYNVSPRFSFFVADDLALGIRLDYSGYTLNTDLRLDLRNVVNLGELAGDDPELKQELDDLLNLRISNRHMVHNAWGISTDLRKYISFFGSRTFAIFGEVRLYGNYGRTISCPIDENGAYVETKLRTSDVYSAGLKLAAGLCIRLRDNSAVTISVPLVGATYSHTQQHKEKTNNNAHINNFKIARNVDFLSVQVGYKHYIYSKKRK